MNITFLNALVFAFVGGIFLNFMPCVFPVLSLKIISLARQKSAGKNKVLQDCAFYTAGILSSMLILASALLLFRATGSLLGWGFQLQSPVVVSALVYITLLIGLSLSGWYELPSTMPLLGPRGSQNVESFLSGVFSSLIGTPCAAPFMVSAVSFSVLQPGLQSIFIFMFMGLGIAFPYVVFSFIPGTMALMPKPGLWMDRLKQFLAFPMYLTTAWLLHVFVSQQGLSSLFPIACSVVLLTFFVWVLKLVSKGKMTGAAFMVLMPVLITALALYAGSLRGGERHNITNNESDSTFSREKLQELLNRNETVLVAVGAEWCLTCKANELVIESEKIQRVLNSKHVLYMKADWTNMDEEISQYLNSMGSGSVPFYALYVKGKLVAEPMPQMLSEGKLYEILERLVR
ncbi:MAG: protein-disulfide reductase DsbD family protein [Aaplasma endosymbiont of Hyalomma asiaticum]